MTIQQSIENKLNQQFEPIHLEVINESHQHNVPDGAESHFRVIVVSEKFLGLSRLSRQRQVYALLEQEMAQSVHALVQRLFTPQEWKAEGERDCTSSPNCRGGWGL